jgi:hypothetical protein
LSEIQELNKETKIALCEILDLSDAIQLVRNNVVHAIVVRDDTHGHVFDLRSKRRTLTKAEIFSAEELTNYFAHAVLALRYALGNKDGAPVRYTLPDRPEIPEFLRKSVPIRKKEDRQEECTPKSFRA